LVVCGWNGDHLLGVSSTDDQSGVRILTSAPGLMSAVPSCC
jgi:hypothetical protein